MVISKNATLSAKICTTNFLFFTVEATSILKTVHNISNLEIQYFSILDDSLSTLTGLQNQFNYRDIFVKVNNLIKYYNLSFMDSCPQ